MPPRRSRIAAAEPVAPFEEKQACPVSQAQIMYHLQQLLEDQPYEPMAICGFCGLENARHPMSLPTDPPELLQAAFHPRVRLAKAAVPSAQPAQPDYQRNKTIRELSEHSRVKGSFNPAAQLPKVFLQDYESKMSVLAGLDHAVWIRVLPSVLHSSVESEFSWVNTNISLVPDMTWEEAKRLFTAHWRKTNSNLLLRRQYEALKQGPTQSVNEFANEFRRLMQLNDLREDERVCDEFVMKLRPDIGNQVLLHLQLRQQAGLAADATSLDLVEEMARLIDSAHEDPKPRGHASNAPESSRPRWSWQKRAHERQDKASPTQAILHCDYHPTATSHVTADCRTGPKKFKPSSDSAPVPPNGKFNSSGGNPATPLGHSNANSGRASLSRATKGLTPKDDAWICIKCKAKAPGHYPKDCPQK